MEIIVTLAVLVLVVVALAAVGLRRTGGSGQRPGPSGDRHPDPEVTGRPAGADAEDTSVDPQRLGEPDEPGSDALPSDAAGKPADPEDRRPEDRRG